MRILGVDPGSRLMGYGCVDALEGNRLGYVAHGTLRLSGTGGRQKIALEQRLLILYEGLSEVVRRTRPEVLVVEKVFFAKNAVSALKLGQARGAVILTGMIHGLSIVEYSPNEVKQAVVGQGHADKEQVAKMVEILLGQRDFETFDASDGLALAICHAGRRAGFGPLSRPLPGAPVRPGAAQQAYAEALRSMPGKRKKKGSSLADALGLGVDQVEGLKGRRRVPAGRIR